MKLLKFSLLAFALSLFSTYVSAQGRIVQKLDFGWKFIAGDIKDAADPAFDRGLRLCRLLEAGRQTSAADHARLFRRERRDRA